MAKKSKSSLTNIDLPLAAKYAFDNDEVPTQVQINIELAAYGEVKSQRAKLQFLEIKQVNDLAAVRKTMMKFISAVLTSASLLLISLGAFLQIRAKAISNSYSDLVRT